MYYDKVVKGNSYRDTSQWAPQNSYVSKTHSLENRCGEDITSALWLSRIFLLNACNHCDVLKHYIMFTSEISHGKFFFSWKIQKKFCFIQTYDSRRTGCARESGQTLSHICDLRELYPSCATYACARTLSHVRDLRELISRARPTRAWIYTNFISSARPTRALSLVRDLREVYLSCATCARKNVRARALHVRIFVRKIVGLLLFETSKCDRDDSLRFQFSLQTPTHK